MSDHLPPGFHTTQLDTSEATTVYVNRLKRKAYRVKAIGEGLLRLLDAIEDEECFASDALASIENHGRELHDLSMIAHTADFKYLHHVLHS